MVDCLICIAPGCVFQLSGSFPPLAVAALGGAVPRRPSRRGTRCTRARGPLPPSDRSAPGTPARRLLPSPRLPRRPHRASPPARVPRRSAEPARRADGASPRRATLRSCSMPFLSPLRATGVCCPGERPRFSASRGTTGLQWSCHALSRRTRRMRVGRSCQAGRLLRWRLGGARSRSPMDSSDAAPSEIWDWRASPARECGHASRRGGARFGRVRRPHALPNTQCKIA